MEDGSTFLLSIFILFSLYLGALYLFPSHAGAISYGIIAFFFCLGFIYFGEFLSARRMTSIAVYIILMLFIAALLSFLLKIKIASDFLVQFLRGG